jgi:hypothetical protein
LAHTFANPCLGHKLKVRVATNNVKRKKRKEKKRGEKRSTH